jgi:hypothetical protein
LCSATELSQLFKLPTLFEHYKEHQKNDSSINFLSFLKLHYFDKTNKDTDKDWESDMKLPFKNSNITSAFSMISTVQKNTVDLDSKWSFTQENKISKIKNDFIPSQLLADIWQPPKSI